MSCRARKSGGAERARGADPSAANGEFAQLESALALAGLDAAASIPLIAPLLNLTLPPAFASSIAAGRSAETSPDGDAGRVGLGASRAQPLVIVTEDLHWAGPIHAGVDPDRLSSRVRGPRCCCCTRQGQSSRCRGRCASHHTQLALNRLSARDVRQMIEAGRGAKGNDG